MTTFGEKLARAREAKGLNRSELARKIGVSPQRITQIEAGTGELKIEPFLLALAHLDVSASYFLPGADFALARARQSDPDIAEAIVLMEATDATGRAVALSHIKAALASYTPKTKANLAA